MEGTLGCSRLIPQRRVTKKFGYLGTALLDLAKPLPPSDLFYVTNGLKGRENQLWSIRGKAAESLRYEDHGRPVRVTGLLRCNPSCVRAGVPHRLATVTRAAVEFLDAEVSQ